MTPLITKHMKFENIALGAAFMVGIMIGICLGTIQVQRCKSTSVNPSEGKTITVTTCE